MIDAGEAVVRSGAFVVVFSVLLIGERLSPLRPRAVARWRRDGENLALFVLGTVCARLLLPAGVVGAAFIAQRHGVGLLHWLNLRLGVAFGLAVIVQDGAVYLQHRMLHTWKPMWLLHRVHHSDRDLDLSSGVRFHPGEIMVAVLYKAVVVVLLGAPPAAVLTFEVLQNAFALFNHSNLALTPRLERLLRAAVVTPAMHWIHHSIRVRETRHNFGFCLSCWDRWFGTYQDTPVDGYQDMQLGIASLEATAAGVVSLLLQPGRVIAEPADGDYPIKPKPAA